MLTIPYITEACVVGVTLPDVTQLCAAVVRVDTSGLGNGGSAIRATSVSLGKIRADLQESGALPMHRLPFLLRVLASGESLPLTHSGKIAKGLVLRQFFGSTELQSMTSLPTAVEVWHKIPTPDELGVEKEAGPAKAWDWGGLQNA